MRCPAITTKEAKRVARELGVPYSRALRAGMRIEREHRDVIGCDTVLAAKIALAHLRERPDYYRRLELFVERPKRRLRRSRGPAKAMETPWWLDMVSWAI